MAQTPLMNLELPTSGPGGTQGPDWADLLNTAFETIDSHDHTENKGSRIPTAGLNINADLSIGSFDLIDMRSARFNNQASSLGESNDKRCLYIVNGDLYYNNSDGTAIQLTSGAGLNAASIGGIGGDYATSNAAVSYSDATKTFSFLQDSGITAKMAVGDLTIFENIASSQGITIKSPASLGGAYNLILPTALPGASKILSVNSSGQIAAVYDVDNSTIEISGNTIRNKDSGITRAKMDVAAFIVPTVQKFTSGSGTYNTPAGVRWIRVRMVGGGGGGASSGGGGSAADGTNGGNTTFGTSLLVANGGVKGLGTTVITGGAGGSASLGTGPIGIAVSGSRGSSGGFGSGGATQPAGGAGGASPFGGAGGGGVGAGSEGGDGTAAAANSGSGGGGGGAGNTASNYSGGGGGSGGYVDAVITAPDSSYAYAVGAAGTGGTEGGNGSNGGAGAAGIIIVEEHYQ